MLLGRSHTMSVVFRGCVFFVIVIVFSRQLPSSAAEHVRDEDQQGWVLEAQRLLAGLSRLAKQPRSRGRSSWSLTEMPADQGIADRLLWRLWLATGMPPLLREEDDTFDKYLLQNVSAYQEYVDKHRNLPLEQIHRLGLGNAVESFGSPLWYMTLRYLAEKASVESEWRILVNTTPSRFLTICPMSKAASSRQSAALARWLKDNMELMVWDTVAKRFRPRDGKYVRTKKLFASLLPDTVTGWDVSGEWQRSENQ